MLCISVVQSYVLVLILNHLMWALWLILQGTIPELVILKKNLAQDLF